jgi:nucleoside-diphosphate-sugar epimerase
MEHPAALNEDFNLSTSEATTVLELARAIWTHIRGSDAPFQTVSDPPFPHDVQRRVPSVEKAERLIGFKAQTGLDEILTEVIPWIERAIAEGTI